MQQNNHNPSLVSYDDDDDDDVYTSMEYLKQHNRKRKVHSINNNNLWKVTAGVTMSCCGTEDEVKRMRRVKNRESVEKCRTKQRLRMERLQVEQTCLVGENKRLGDAVTQVECNLQLLCDLAAQIQLHGRLETKIKTALQ